MAAADPEAGHLRSARPRQKAGHEKRLYVSVSNEFIGGPGAPRAEPVPPEQNRPGVSDSSAGQAGQSFLGFPELSQSHLALRDGSWSR